MQNVTKILQHLCSRLAGDLLGVLIDELLRYAPNLG